PSAVTQRLNRPSAPRGHRHPWDPENHSAGRRSGAPSGWERTLRSCASPRNDEVAETVDAGFEARIDEDGRVGLFEYCRTCDSRPDAKLKPIIDRCLVPRSFG